MERKGLSFFKRRAAESQQTLEGPHHGVEPKETNIQPHPPQFETEDQNGAPEHTKGGSQPLLPAIGRARAHRRLLEGGVKADGVRHVLVV